MVIKIRVSKSMNKGVPPPVQRAFGLTCGKITLKWPGQYIRNYP